jgi:plastocyanin
VNAAAHSVISVLAASEPSKVPFYILGGLLASWAVVLSAFGLSHADFPGSPARGRAVMGISAVLMLATVTSAVATSGKHQNEGEAKAEHKAPEKGQPPPPGGGGTLQVSADPTGQLKFEETSLTTKAGKVTIDFDNPSPIDHNVTITAGQGSLGGTKTVANRKVSAVVDLKAGSYTFYCSVDAHRQAGMEGKLTVS